MLQQNYRYSTRKDKVGILRFPTRLLSPVESPSTGGRQLTGAVIAPPEHSVRYCPVSFSGTSCSELKKLKRKALIARYSIVLDMFNTTAKGSFRPGDLGKGS